ncbi:hypothetical protein V5O48_010982 [Marasmius crinis-equi]|uniref:Short-chain dehydrogenase n=1 Tax=Marasmius crinis-equi TaxID=585013 RepID=A0ABR3F7A5_9AGAR
MKFTQEQFVQEQKAGMPPAVEGVFLHGQVVIITGANTGIGFEAAKHFAIREPAKLIMVCRSESKGQDALQRVKSETGFQSVELWTVDFSSFDSVKAIKKKIEQLDRLDILVANAAVGMYDYLATKDGWETTLQVNVLSFALHVILHLPKLLETAKNHPNQVPRIVLVSSDGHYLQTISSKALDALNTLEFMTEQSQFDRSGRYSESKLLATMWMRALQPHLSTITCVSVNPGLCRSELARNARDEAAQYFSNLMSELGFTCEEGGRQLLYAGIGQRDRESELRQAYVSFSRVSECSDWILGEEGQKFEKKLWQEVNEVVGEVDKTAGEIIQKYLS